MTKPRVFVSSTYYDLRHIRASLECFISNLGFEPILSEKGDIAYSPDIALDKSCYREVENSDVFVLIIGGRYGAEKSDTKSELSKQSYDRYDSITEQEYLTAANKDIPIYVLIEKSVYSDFETYLRNKDNQAIRYAHVDSVSIFQLIEEILSKPRNNPIHQFDTYDEIENWLKEQWAGLFRELLNHMSAQQQLSSLNMQVKELSEISKTLKTYLEEVVSKVAPVESLKIIASEKNRLENALKEMILKDNIFYLNFPRFGFTEKDIRSAIESTSTFQSFLDVLTKGKRNNKFEEYAASSGDFFTRGYEELKSKLATVHVDATEGPERPP